MSETADEREVVCIDQLLRVNYLRMVQEFALRVFVIAALFMAGGAVEQWVPGETPLMGVFIVPAVLLFIFMVFRFVFGIRVIKCKGVLRTYPLEFRRRVVKKSEEWTKYGDLFTLRIADGNPGTAPLLRAAKAIGGRRWPKGTENGVWVAGDVDFGGVIVVPISGEMLFFQPANWHATAPAREQAAPDRQEKASRARLLRKAL